MLCAKRGCRNNRKLVDRGRFPGLNATGILLDIRFTLSFHNHSFGERPLRAAGSDHSTGNRLMMIILAPDPPMATEQPIRSKRSVA
jgi:hypothetical protein